MELFTLGRGHYTEPRHPGGGFLRVHWLVHPGGRFREIAAQHDTGEKAILGHTGRFDGDDVPALLLDQPACAEFLCTKLVRAFVTETDTVTPELVAPLAESFRIGLRDPCATWNDPPFGPVPRPRDSPPPSQVPRRACHRDDPSTRVGQADGAGRRAGRSLRPDGSALYAPPSVAGWDGGTAWANSTTMLNRTNLILALLGQRMPLSAGGSIRPPWARKHDASTTEQGADFFIDLLVHRDGFDAGLRKRVDATAITKAKDPGSGIA